MGYTHYWENSRRITNEEWKNITEKLQVILETVQPDIKLTGCYKGEDVYVDDKCIVINGEGDDSHETCQINRDKIQFGFCKTARKPYDIVVCSLLILTSTYAEGFSYSSDGGLEEWEDAISLVAKSCKNEG